MLWAQSTYHKGLYQGWKETSIYPLVSHSMSHYFTSLFFSNRNSNYIHDFGTETQNNNNTCFGACLFLRALKTGTCNCCLQWWTGWPVLFCGPTQEPVIATANTGKARERFWKNAGKWTGSIELARKKTLAVSVACVALYWPTPGFKGVGEPSSSVFSTDGTLISASAAPHCGVLWEQIWMMKYNNIA